MNNVTYIKNILQPNQVELREIGAVYAYITSDLLVGRTNALRLCYKKSIDNNLSPEERNLNKIQYERDKNTLESVVFSGEFTERNNNALTLYWARVVLDIDHIPDEKTYAKIKDYFINLPYTIMAFKSPSGYGLKVVVKVTYKGERPETNFHTQSFNALKETHDKALKKFKVEIDGSGKDIARTCFLCTDNKAYFNLEADSTGRGFDFKYKELKVQEDITYKRNTWYNYIEEKNFNDNIDLVEDMLTFCEQNNIDLTKTYENWLTIMWALKQSLGDDGFEYFVAFSKNYKDFNKDEAKKKWDSNTIDTRKPVVTLGSIVYLCRQYGYEINRNIKNKEYLFNAFIDKLIADNIYIRFESDSGRLQIKDKEYWRLFTDIDEDEIRIRTFNGKMNKADVTSFINAVSPSVSLHIEFINSLPEWDGKDRFQSLADTLETEDEVPMKLTYIRKWCVGFIAQLHNDGMNGNVNENMIILSGPQYAGKTRWCKKLMPNEWQEFFVTKNIDLTQKDDHLLLSQKYIVFMDEGLSLRKNDVRALKTLLSSDKYTGRPAYGRHNRDYIRYCSFIASTNDEQILSDDTGNRRYWVIPITKINFNHNIDMMQLWSQALHLYRNNEQYWLSDEEVEIVKDVNAQFEVEDQIEYYLSKYLQKGEGYYSSTEIRDYIVSNEGKQVYSELSIYRIGRVLKKMGYKKIKKRCGTLTKNTWNVEFVSIVKPITSTNIFTN